MCIYIYIYMYVCMYIHYGDIIHQSFLPPGVYLCIYTCMHMYAGVYASYDYPSNRRLEYLCSHPVCVISTINESVNSIFTCFVTAEIWIYRSYATTFIHHLASTMNLSSSIAIEEHKCFFSSTMRLIMPYEIWIQEGH